MQIIIVGAGEVGSAIAESLADSHDVTILDIDPARVEELNYTIDVLAIEGDGANLDTLHEAGAATADMVIACTDNDETNIVTCGTAKTLGDAFTIARIKEAMYLETWEHSNHAFGVDFMVGTNVLAAKAIVQVLGLPAARDVDAFAGGRVQMAEFEIPASSPVANQTIEEADRFDSLTFAAVLREDGVIIPTGATNIEPGDEIVVIGSDTSVREFAAEIEPHHNGVSDVFIAGGTNIGYQTARLLEEKGLRVRLVERDAELARQLAEELPKTVVMQDDPTDRSFLESEHVEKADAFIAALGNDEKNLMACLIARKYGVTRTITVVEEPEYVDLFEEAGVSVAIHPQEVIAEEITRFTRERRAENVSLIESDRAEVMEFKVDEDSALVDRPIWESIREFPDGVIIGAITRNGELIIPRGETVIRANDHVIVFVDASVIDEVIGKL